MKNFLLNSVEMNLEIFTQMCIFRKVELCIVESKTNENAK